MKLKAITLAVILGIAIAGGTGLAVADHDGGENCDELDNANDAIDENAPEEAQDNNAVDRAQDECNGDHGQDEANDAGENGGDNGGEADDRSNA